MDRLIITDDGKLYAIVTDTALSLYLGGIVKLFEFNLDTQEITEVNELKALSPMNKPRHYIVMELGRLTDETLQFWNVKKKVFGGKWYVELDSLLKNFASFK